VVMVEGMVEVEVLMEVLVVLVLTVLVLVVLVLMVLVLVVLVLTVLALMGEVLEGEVVQNVTNANRKGTLPGTVQIPVADKAGLVMEEAVVMEEGMEEVLLGMELAVVGLEGEVLAAVAAVAIATNAAKVVILQGSVQINQEVVDELEV
jgi:hypothetical protein